jgi:hypothetical protein
MIRFSASLVVVGLGLLVAGGISSKLLLVYVAIAVSAIALVFLIIGAILDREELRTSSTAEAPGDRLDEVAAGRLDRSPADDRREAAAGRPDSVASGVPGDDLARRPDRLVAGARGDDPPMHGEAPIARPGAGSTADTVTAETAPDTRDPVTPATAADTRDTVIAETAPDTRDPVTPATAADTRDPVSTNDTANIADHTGPTDNSSSGDTENVKDTGGTGGVEDLADTQSADQLVTVVPGVPRYHRSDCILIRFMGGSDLQEMPVEAARKNGCTPCRACHTGGEETG